jgi:hypothetical protein
MNKVYLLLLYIKFFCESKYMFIPCDYIPTESVNCSNNLEQLRQCDSNGTIWCCPKIAICNIEVNMCNGLCIYSHD